VLVLAALAGFYRYRSRSRFQITSKDTIVLADFVNTTGEAVFDDALRQGLEIGLRQSPFVQVLSDRKVAAILTQMGRSSDARMTGHTALDVCQRTGSKVTVQGSIASLGTTYLIGLAAIRCDNGDPVANEQIEAKRKEDVVDALGRASTQLRERLGESLPSIQKYNAPLEQATTPSLEALNAYGVALSTWDKKGDEASLPFFKKAIELDPNFAMAYGALATIYHNLGESALAKENTAKAYQVRDRVTESEKATIESRYFMYVTGELEKAADAYAASIHNYPQSATPLNQLGSIDGQLGRYEQALENLRAALALDPTLKAVSDLDSAVQLEFAGPPPLSVAPIYPAYVRGYAYLSAGDGAKAAAEFQKLIDHSGIVLNFPLAPLARLGRARAYARSGDAVKARAAYLDFLQLWKDADPDLPILKQAKDEYAKLQPRIPPIPRIH